MTTIVGVHIPGKGTWIGSDRVATTQSLRIGGINKWVMSDGWAVGYAGYMLVLNLIEENAKDLLANLKSPRMLANRLRKLMLENHISPERDDDEGLEMWGHSILLASPDGLWEISTEMVVQPIRPGVVWAAGSGQKLALGAGRAAMILTEDPEKAVRMAVDAAIHYDLTSGGDPFTMHLEPKPKKTPVVKKMIPKNNTRARSAKLQIH